MVGSLFLALELADLASDTFITIQVSGLAVSIGSLIGIPLGAIIALKGFRGKATLLTIIHALIGIPPVLAGLLIYMLLSRSGPLGYLELLFTPQAMVLAQLVIVLPIIIGLTASSVEAVGSHIKDLILSLGGGGLHLIMGMLKEARLGVFSSVIVAFGRAISEVGAVLMVGGGIRFHTRTLTVGILRNIEVGEFLLAIELGLVLLTLGFAVNLLLTRLGRAGLRWR